MRFSSRAFAICTMSAAAIAFGGTVAANVATDPQQVLGTSLIGPSDVPNDRYFRFRHYLAGADRYDGLAFGTSRGPTVPDETMSRNMRGASFATFAVVAGQMPDHLTVLEYAVQRAGPSHRQIEAVFLLLGADFFGERQIGNRAMHTLWHPVLTGESMARFMWRYATAIQPRAWRAAVRSAWQRQRDGSKPPLWVVQLARTPVIPARDEPQAIRRDAATDSAPVARAPTAEDIAKRNRVLSRPSFIRARPEFQSRLAALRRFVEICRRNDIQLVVALTPLNTLNASRFDPEELETVAEMIADIVPVWDFGSPAWLSARTDWWYDNSHYSSEIQTMMMSRIFGTPGARQDFGVLRGTPGKPPG